MPRLLSWNVLADAYVRPAYFPFTPPALLAPGARTAAVVERLAASDADVVCLQEVERPLVSALEAGLPGYSVRFLQKSGKPDGCALLLRTSTAELLGARELTYSDGSGHVALLAELRFGELSAGVATSHIKWDPPATPYPERWATRQLTELVAAMDDRHPWIACGDFNVTPEDPVLGLLERLADVYRGSAWETATINANRRARRIDYLFASPALACQPLPVPLIDATTPLPSPSEPSDHLVIGATFAARPLAGC